MMTKLDWVLDESFIKTVLGALPEVDVVSFDLFDTAITRLVESPRDVFAQVESLLGPGNEGFAQARLDAEARARSKAGLEGREEISFDDIYDELQDLYTPIFIANAKATEKRVEQSLLVAVPDILELTRALAQQGKPWIIVSDMYLDKEFLSDVLTNLGFSGWQHLYVSSQIGQTKHRGSIWTTVKKDLPDLKILHIGDNHWSDGFVPTLSGLQTLEYKRVLSETRGGAHLTSDLVPFSVLSRQVVLNSKAEDDPQLWRDLGYKLGGPLVASFLHWIADRVNVHKIKRLYFMARDGALLYRAWSAIDPSGSGNPYVMQPIETKYLQVSRKSLIAASGFIESKSNRLTAHLRQYLCAADSRTTVHQLVARTRMDNPGFTQDVLSIFPDWNKPIIGYPNWLTQYNLLISRYSAAIYEALEVEYSAAYGYLHQNGLFDGVKAAVVDSGWNGSIQRHLNVLREHHGWPSQKKLQGFYYGLWNDSQMNRFRGGPMEAFLNSPFGHPSDTPGLALGVGLIEELHGANSGTVQTYHKVGSKWLPITKEQTQEELDQYLKKIKWFQLGALDYVQLAHSNPSLIWSAKEVNAALNQVFVTPSKTEHRLLLSLRHSIMFDHIEYPTIEQPMPNTEEEASKVIEASDWRPGLILHWIRNGDPNRREELHRLAQKHLGNYLNPEQLRYGYLS